MASTSALRCMLIADADPGFRIGALRAVDAKPLAGGTAAGLGKERVK